MINLLIGPPGGGKSYEAVVFHLLPALAKGRKVITNLPLDLAKFDVLDPNYRNLIELRTRTLAERPSVDWDKAQSMYQRFGIAAKVNYFIDRPFAHAADYGDPWRHEKDGSGPLYIIDECHLSLPRGSTERAVEEWYSLHRHESADVLLITQSYGKVSKSIIDLVQVCYRVKKATAFGSSNRYIRKVQDGVRGDVVNTGVREYERKYFGLYRSHTRGGGAELAAQDIIPIWRRWPVIGAGVAAFLVMCIVIYNPSALNPFAAARPKAAKAAEKAEASPRSKSGQIVVPGSSSPAAVPSPSAVEPDPGSSERPKVRAVSVTVKLADSPDPYADRGLHLVGVMRSSHGKRIMFAMSQNGQHVAYLTDDDLERVGYSVQLANDCTAFIRYQNGAARPVICDAPQLSVLPVGGAVWHGERGKQSTGGAPANSGEGAGRVATGFNGVSASSALLPAAGRSSSSSASPAVVR